MRTHLDESTQNSQIKHSILSNASPRSEIHSRISGVYFLIKQQEIVYIGQSKNVMARLTAHDRENVGEFDSFSWIHCPSGFLDEFEARCIFAFLPRLNKAFPKNRKILTRREAKAAVLETYGQKLTNEILSSPDVLSIEIREGLRYYDVDSLFDVVEGALL